MGAVTDQCIIILISDDEIIEGHETFTVTLTVITTNARTRVGNTETVVTIYTSIDDREC